MWGLITLISRETTPRITTYDCKPATQLWTQFSNSISVGAIQALKSANTIKLWRAPPRHAFPRPPLYCVLYLDCTEFLLQLHTGDIKAFWMPGTSSPKPFHIHERPVSRCTLASVHTFLNIRLWLELGHFGCPLWKRWPLSLTAPRLHTYMSLFGTGKS